MSVKKAKTPQTEKKLRRSCTICNRRIMAKGLQTIMLSEIPLGFVCHSCFVAGVKLELCATEDEHFSTSARAKRG